MKRKLHTSLISALIVVGLSGCAAPQQRALTPEEAARVQAIQEALLARLKGQVPAQPQQQIPEEPAISAEDFQAQIARVKAAGNPAKVVMKSNQLLIDGKPYLDSEGSIQKYSSDSATGDFTYLIKTTGNQAIIKFNRAGSALPAVKVATINPGPEGVAVKTVTGKSYSGSTAIPTADGFIVSRSNAAFHFSVDNSQRDFSIKQGFHLAKFQQGNVAGTGYVLLEKDDDQSQSQSLISSFKSIGSTLGISKAYDYLLVNLESGREIPLNLPSDTKKVAVYSNCKKKNSVVNKCENMDSFESLYEPNGQPNYSHYFWSVDWLNGSSAPVAIYKETTKVKAINMETGKIYTLFSRALGVNYFTAEINAAGKISVTARLGFSNKVIEDVEQFMLENEDKAELLVAER